MAPGKYRIRVRVTGGKVKGSKVVHVLGRSGLHVSPYKGVSSEFVLCADTEARLAEVRRALDAANLEEIEGSTELLQRPGQGAESGPRRPPAGGPRGAGGRRGSGSARGTHGPPTPGLRKKPYGFVPLPDAFTTGDPVWHDGTSSAGRLSGEVRFELECLTPLLVGWQQQEVKDRDDAWAIPHVPAPGGGDGEVEVALPGVGRTVQKKSVLCPLRAPWGQRPVLIPGDSLKGLLRHELGALLGAPMERVAERSYSYRPNSMHPHVGGEPAPRLVPRLARVPEGGVEEKPLHDGGPRVRVPARLELLPEDLRYDSPRRPQSPPHYRFDASGGAPYRGGMGAGDMLNSKRDLHDSLLADPDVPTTRVNVPCEVQEGYLHTLRHLLDTDRGHFSERHPDVPEVVTGPQARERILEAARSEVFSPGDMVWVEWDTEDQRIVSLGWHYYYRWAYQDTVRRKGRKGERPGLFPHDDERRRDDDGAPHGLTAARRLFGYTGDNEGSKGIGKDDHEQLMGRLSVNAAVEVVQEDESDTDRFLPPIFLKELGMPRPSAVEFYLEQPHHPNARPSDRATLLTYGDTNLGGYDAPGKLAGRKFYLDRRDAYEGEPWKDDSRKNRDNERATLALEATRPGRRFRFTLRFRDLDPDELAATLLALCPNQFAGSIGGKHGDGYCSKLGYARPLGWGSVHITAKDLLLLRQGDAGPLLEPVEELASWFQDHYAPSPMLRAWLDIHRHKHPEAADYPDKEDRTGQRNIYTFHTDLRAQHSRWRRHDKRGRR